jgi:hypothetical protein
VSALPRLIDAKGIAQELGVTRAVARSMIDQLSQVRVPGVRKVYVTREELAALIENSRQEPPSGPVRRAS